MYTITKRPIVILSAPRTGSTALGMYVKTLCKDPKIKIFAEPDWGPNNLMEKFLLTIDKDDNYIVKTHLININRYPQNLVDFFTTSESAYRIRIRRRSFVDQVTSYYVAINRDKKWIYKKKLDRNFVPDTIEINKIKLERQIRYLYNCNQVLNDSKLHYDLDLYYEDLPPMNNIPFYVSPKPTNYQVLRDTVKETMSQMRDRNF